MTDGCGERRSDILCGCEAIWLKAQVARVISKESSRCCTCHHIVACVPGHTGCTTTQPWCANLNSHQSTHVSGALVELVERCRRVMTPLRDQQRQQSVVLWLSRLRRLSIMLPSRSRQRLGPIRSRLMLVPESVDCTIIPSFFLVVAIESCERDEVDLCVFTKMLISPSVPGSILASERNDVTELPNVVGFGVQVSKMLRSFGSILTGSV